ncbi:hypothetical protein VTN00DRAFT_6409 [Thermoascus crustaceus]|uniref:uncharacterized protein n=1 Tax=Thermoascus crustaceus TaxID=5088 RepID=UPI003743DC0F
MVGYGEKSLNPQWPNNAKIAVSFVINYEEGAERCVLNGDGTNEVNIWEGAGGTPHPQERAVNIESEYEYGSRSGVWRLFRLFNKYNMEYTLYAVGKAIEDNPAVAISSVENAGSTTTLSHPTKKKNTSAKPSPPSNPSPAQPPKGWYYGRLSTRSRALVWDVYKEMNLPLLWESDSCADDVPYWVDVPAEKDSLNNNPQGMLMIPYSYDCNDRKFSIPNGFSAPMDFYDHVKGAFDVLYEEGEAGMPKMMTVGLHCRCIGKPARFAALKRFVEYIAEKEGVWVATRTQMAGHFREKFPYRRGQLA